MLPSAATAVQPSSSTITSGLPAFTMGSMAITMPAFQLHALARFAKVRHLRILVHVNPDAVAHKIPHHRKPFTLNHSLHRGAYIAQSCPRPNRRNSRLQRRFRRLQQPRSVRRRSSPTGTVMAASP